ncbi:hypothetical protein D3C81_1361460 [compost metagenome]
MQDVCITHDVTGAGGADQAERYVFGDQRFEERLPCLARPGRQFVGEIDQLHAVLAMQARQFLREQYRIAMAPACPESALPAVAAQVRAAARELHHHRLASAPIGVAVVVNQFPTDAVGIEVNHHLRIAGAGGHTVDTQCDACNGAQVVTRCVHLHQLPGGVLALATDDAVNGRNITQHVPPVIGGEHAAIDDPHARQALFQCPSDADHRGMCRAGTGVAHHHHVRGEARHCFDDAVHRQGPDVGIEQLHVMACVQQRATDAQQPKRRRVHGRACGHGDMAIKMRRAGEALMGRM